VKINKAITSTKPTTNSNRWT